ncbi:MAG: hypothetical protein II670_07730 [Alphaproteobacteria bacterium]|nr:hypothetical protein [Alphaproteobacteria bacterium]
MIAGSAQNKMAMRVVVVPLSLLQLASEFSTRTVDGTMATMDKAMVVTPKDFIWFSLMFIFLF